MGEINRVGGVHSSDFFTCCCFAVQLCETTSCMGFHDHQGTGIGINWVSEVYNFSIKLDSLWPVCLPDLWLDGVNANMIVELGYKEVCVCVCFGTCIPVLFQMDSLQRHNVTRGKGIDRPLTVYVIVKQASLIVCLCVFF